ncbi:FadR/GntR family transcriptional regulator [Nocardioides pocheonensis]|uniref:FadR family transcriptional regulator n=1 Tax=Nocardioides pocheonensis TaxID=661485 RepID=A0A3N0GLP5_9ACTN|nr:FadR/GntR family transcriptional regulator [Nocardioides pocheonensis]RNM12980.1 FadR family transcriptional regulator [Nocardioides pocheonensis]
MTSAGPVAGGAEGLPDWARRPANLANALAGELVQRIVRGDYPPGTAMPSEPALCESYSVSRTVVREAVKMLQEKGLVQVRRGSGTVVNPDATWNMLDELVLTATVAEDNGLEVLDDLVVTRRILESDMAHVAARLAEAEVVAQLEELVDAMDTLVNDPTAYAVKDRAFHDTIMRASGNRIARAVVRALESQVVNTARYVGEIRPDLCVASNRGHRNVYLRIADHDPEGAAQAMFTHITEAWVVRRGGPGEPDRLQR